MGRCLVLVVVCTLLACDNQGSSSTTAAPATYPSAKPETRAPLLEPRPKLRKDMVETEIQPGLSVAVRCLTPSLSSEDPVRLVLRFKATGGALGSDRPPPTWAHTFNTLRVSLRDPNGNEHELAAAGSIPSTSGPPLAHESRRMVYLGKAGIEDRSLRWHADWSKPMTSLFPARGQYQLALGGQVKLGAETLSFQSEPLDLDVAAALDSKPLEQIDDIAASFLKQHKGLHDAPDRTLPIVEDEAGHRVVRFVLRDAGEGSYMDDFCEVIVSRAGTVLSVLCEKIFTCVAEGTAIATPNGPRPVETMAAGDLIVGHDVESGRRVETRVRAIAPAYSVSLIALTDALTVSARHPVFADGAWVEAHAVAPGAALLGMGGRQLAIPQALATGATVYDLWVDWPHTFFAGGVLVHNKAGESPEGRNMRTNLDARPRVKR